MTDDPKYELEYKTLSENIRWWSNLRFAQLTLFAVVMAALFGTVNDPVTQLSWVVVLGLKVGGFCTSLVFLYLEIRANQYWTHFVQRAAEIEEHLGFKQYASRPIRSLRTSHLLRLFFLAIAIYWAFSILGIWFWPHLV